MQFLFVVVSGIAPTKRDLAVSKRDQAMIGDGHAMGVAARDNEAHVLGRRMGVLSRPPSPFGTAVSATRRTIFG